MDTSNVDSVGIGGEPKKGDGEPVGVDPAAVARQAEGSRNRVVDASGFQLPTI